MERIKSGSQRWAAEPMENDFPRKCPGNPWGHESACRHRNQRHLVQVTMETRLSTRLIFNSSTDATSSECISGHLLLSTPSMVRTHGCQFNIGEPNILTSSFISPDFHPREWIHQCFYIRPPVVEERFRCWALEMT